jgi:hypothetical protein
VPISTCNPPPPQPCPSSPPVHGSSCRLNECVAGPPIGDCNYGACSDGLPQTVARCDGSTWSVTTNRCEPPDCAAEQSALHDFARANKACQADSDCTIVTATCASPAEFCDGSFFVNKSIDVDRWNQLAGAVFDCVTSQAGGCAICDAIPPAPVCANGACANARGL